MWGGTLIGALKARLPRRPALLASVSGLGIGVSLPLATYGLAWLIANRLQSLGPVGVGLEAPREPSVDTESTLAPGYQDLDPELDLVPERVVDASIAVAEATRDPQTNVYPHRARA